jgi:hypothetical protein
MTWQRIVLAVTLMSTVTVGVGQAQTPGAPAPSTPSAPGGQEASPSAAPSSSPEEFKLTRAAIQAQRQAIVSEAMDLDAAQTQIFWPLYRDYRLAIGKVDDRVVALLTRYLDAYPNLSDTQASQLLDEMISIEDARNNVKREYIARFRKVLPDRTVARFFQVERKLDSVVNAELAERVPLVE